MALRVAASRGSRLEEATEIGARHSSANVSWLDLTVAPAAASSSTNTSGVAPGGASRHDRDWDHSVTSGPRRDHAGAAEHPHHLGRRYRAEQSQLLQRWADGLSDTPHRPD